MSEDKQSIALPERKTKAMPEYEDKRSRCALQDNVLHSPERKAKGYA